MPQDSMTRSDLVEELAARFGQLTHKDAEFAVKTILTPSARPGQRPSDRDSGLWQFLRQSPPSSHGPQSTQRRSRGDPRKARPHFKPGKALREAVTSNQPSTCNLSSPKNLFKDQRCENHTRGTGSPAKRDRYGTPSPCHCMAHKQHQNS